MTCSEPKLRYLWRADLQVGPRKDYFLFRSNEDFATAAKLAEELLDSSPACDMAGAVIVALERSDRLWN